MRPRTDRSLWPGAFLGLALVGLTSRALPVQPAPKPTGDWWDVGCWLMPWAPFCPVPVKDPPMPKPKQLAPDVPPCGTFDGPCR
jgi:hypothetical protein